LQEKLSWQIKQQDCNKRRGKKLLSSYLSRSKTTTPNANADISLNIENQGAL
jgi:hypothetical protein